MLLVAAVAAPALALGGSPPGMRVFLVRGDGVVAVPRAVSTVQDAVAALLAGPSAAEVAARLLTEVPTGTTIRRIRVDGHIARVSLSTPFGVAGAGPADGRDLQLRLAQLVYTVTAVPGVDRVEMLVNGAPVDFLEAGDRPGFRLRGSFSYVGTGAHRAADHGPLRHRLPRDLQGARAGAARGGRRGVAPRLRALGEGWAPAPPHRSSPDSGVSPRHCVAA